MEIFFIKVGKKIEGVQKNCINFEGISLANCFQLKFFRLLHFFKNVKVGKICNYPATFDGKEKKAGLKKCFTFAHRWQKESK